MKSVQIPASLSYHDYLIESLQDPKEAAGYIEVALEEGNDEPRLLPKVLRNIVEAYSRIDGVSDLAKQQQQKLDKMLTESSCAEIYSFIKLLNQLGFKVKIEVKS